MHAVRLRRLSIALVAAYAMALQALLAAFVPLPLAAFAESPVLCSASGEGGPPSHDGSCPALCAVFGGHGTAAALPPAGAAGIAAPVVQAARLVPAEWNTPRLASRGLSSQRGPPEA